MLRKRNLARSFRKAIKDPAYAVSVFTRRLKSYLAYRFGNGISSAPETVSLFLTYNCNLRCTMCGQWGEDGWARKLAPDVVKRELDRDVISRLIDDLAPYRPAITLFGGEPLLSENWPFVVERAKAAGMRVNMISNGTLLDRHIDTIIDLGVDEIIFSLDGPEEIHDEIRSGKGIFSKATGAFRTLAERKRARNSRIPRVNVNTTIFETNYRRFPEVIQVAEDIGADAITFHHLIFVSHETCSRNSRVFKDEFNLVCSDWTGFARETLPDIDPDELIGILHGLSSRHSRVAVTVYPNLTDDEIRRYYTDFDFQPSSYAPRCLSPWTTAYIFPNGDVKPCLDTCYIAGNVTARRFREIWNGGPMKRYREVLKRRGHFPACTRCTEFYRA